MGIFCVYLQILSEGNFSSSDYIIEHLFAVRDFIRIFNEYFVIN